MCWEIEVSCYKAAKKKKKKATQKNTNKILWLGKSTKVTVSSK